MVSGIYTSTTYVGKSAKEVSEVPFLQTDRRVPSRGSDYVSLLNLHNMQSLTYRREIASSKFLIKLMNYRIDSPCFLSQVSLTVPRSGMRFTNLFYIPKSRTNYLVKSPLVHMTRNANKYCDDPFCR